MRNSGALCYFLKLLNNKNVDIMAHYSTIKTQMDIQPISFWEQQQLPVSGWNVTMYVFIKILVIAIATKL